MQFSYMKLAIYALTFLTYAYSGYGSSTIASLRDAIIAAEAIFGDVFHNLITVAKKFKTVHEVFDAAVDENCVFTCPGGGKAVQNKMYTPSSDGCGSLGLSISTEYLPAAEMGACCNEHDICYDTCNSDKELCDLDFKRCLYRHCETYDKTIASDIVIKSCKGAAKMLFTGTLTLGCKSFLDAQKRTCYCAPPKENKYQKNSNNNNNNYNNNNNKNYKDKKQKFGWKDEF